MSFRVEGRLLCYALPHQGTWLIGGIDAKSDKYCQTYDQYYLYFCKIYVFAPCDTVWALRTWRVDGKEAEILVLARY